MTSNAVTFGPAQATDLEAIVALLADDPLGAGRETDDMEPYRRAFAAIDANPHQILVAGRLDDELVATAQLSFLPGLSHRGTTRCDMEAVRVVPRLRGQGIGAELCDWTIEQAQQHGCGLIQLSSHNTRLDAHRFYERLGFESTHTGMKLWLGDPEPHL